MHACPPPHGNLIGRRSPELRMDKPSFQHPHDTCKRRRARSRALCENTAAISRQLPDPRPPRVEARTLLPHAIGKTELNQTSTTNTPNISTHKWLLAWNTDAVKSLLRFGEESAFRHALTFHLRSEIVQSEGFHPCEHSACFFRSSKAASWSRRLAVSRSYQNKGKVCVCVCQCTDSTLRKMTCKSRVRWILK